MTAATSHTDAYLAQFEGLKGAFKSKNPSWLLKERERAIAAFAKSGFPTIKDEEWKYLRLSALLQTPFESVAKAPVEPSTSELKPHLLESSRHLVFVNGQLSRDLSDLRKIPGVRVEPLEDSTAVALKSVGHVSEDDNPFFALNTAFFDQGFLIHISEGVSVKDPLVLLFWNQANGVAPLISPRIKVVLEEGAKLTLVERYVGQGLKPYFTNAVTEINLCQDAQLDHYKLQQEDPKAFHIGSIEIDQAQGSKFSSHSISLGGAIARNTIHSRMDAEFTESTLNGLYMVTGDQQVDHHTRIDHLKPNGTSASIYKGILDGNSKGIFNGKVIVHPNAQKTDAKQMNKNLLLSETAEADPKPELQIHADDVKCTHGATVGQLDEDALFYLRSRGIGENESKNFLTYAFASDLVDKMQSLPVREAVGQMLVSKMMNWHLE